MKIEEFIQNVKKYGCDTRCAGSIITLHRVEEYYVREDMFSDRKKQTRLKTPFIIMNVIKSQFVTDKFWKNADGLDFEKLQSVLALVNKVKNTPVQERFAEKVWWLRWIHHDSFLGADEGYLEINKGFWDMAHSRDDATIFTNTDLKKLKQDYPKFAPAIDAIKEPVPIKDAVKANKA